jgi:type III restriction enzyme
MTGTTGAATAIENPVINSPFVEPTKHFAFGADGRPTGEIAEGRRPSAAITCLTS